MKILFHIKSFNVKDRLLSVQCKIEDIGNKEFIQLYLGKVKYSDLQCSNFIEQKHGFAIINTSNSNDLGFSYTVAIGHLSKHGHSGEITDKLIAFAGEQVFIFPVEILTIEDTFNSIINNITIYFDFKGYKNSIFPLKSNIDKLFIDFPKWINIYDIMKSSYVFGNFNIYNSIYNENVLEFFSEEKFTDKKINLSFIDDIKRLHRYYCDLFNSNGMNLSLVLLNKSIDDEKYVLGGSGISTIATTFYCENERDWQLLAHRMFHAFMDYKLKSREMHIPPNLWLTEGLATYYEIKALNVLSDTRKKSLNLNIEGEFKKLFARYLYMKLREVNISNIIPMNEKNIRNHGSIEFLHYTLAPLIVKLIEDKYNKLNNDNCIIHKIILLNENNNDFSMENIFFNILKENINEFANKFLFNNEVLPLWFLGEYDLNKNEIIQDLNYYEYVLWTWFKLEDENYVLYEANDESLDKIVILANEFNINFANKELESQVEEFCSIIYKLLKEYALRARICSVPYNNTNLRKHILANEEKVALWNNFLEDFLIKN